MKRNIYHDNWIIKHLWFIYLVFADSPDGSDDQMSGYEYCITFMPMNDPQQPAGLIPDVQENIATSKKTREE